MMPTASTHTKKASGFARIHMAIPTELKMIKSVHAASIVATRAIRHTDHSSTFLTRCTLAIITMIGVDLECVYSPHGRELLMFNWIAERA